MNRNMNKETIQRSISQQTGHKKQAPPVPPPPPPMSEEQERFQKERKAHMHELKEAFRQKENKYVPLLNLTARSLVPRERKHHVHRAVQFLPEEEEEAPVIEVDPNPVYLRQVSEDYKFTKPGEPFHPSFPGANKGLKEYTAAKAERNQRALEVLVEEEVEHQRHSRGLYSHNAARKASGILPPGYGGGGGNDSGNSSRGLDLGGSGSGFEHQPFLANTAFQAPAGAKKFDPYVANQQQNNHLFLQQQTRRGLIQKHQKLVTSHNATRDILPQGSEDLQTEQDRQRALEDEELDFQLRAQHLAASSLHQQHSIRHSCQDAVGVVRALLYFRSVDTNAREGPHNEITSRFMQLEFLRDLQWLLKDGVTLIKYPTAGAGGAAHMRYFTIWNIPWSAGPRSPPMMAPFLVWTSDKKSTNAIGKAPLCNLLGTSTDLTESGVLRRYQNEDGLTIKGPQMNANKRVKIPLANIATLWFLCHVAFVDTVAHDAARQLDPKQADKLLASQQAASGGGASPIASSSSPSSVSPGTSHLTAEERAARGLAPSTSSPQQQQQQQQQQQSDPRSRLLKPSNRQDANAASSAAAGGGGGGGGAGGGEPQHPKVHPGPGSMGRMAVDVAAFHYGEIERFLALMSGIESVNSVVVRRAPAAGAKKRALSPANKQQQSQQQSQQQARSHQSQQQQQSRPSQSQSRQPQQQEQSGSEAWRL